MPPTSVAHGGPLSKGPSRIIPCSFWNASMKTPCCSMPASATRPACRSTRAIPRTRPWRALWAASAITKPSTSLWAGTVLAVRGYHVQPHPGGTALRRLPLLSRHPRDRGQLVGAEPVSGAAWSDGIQRAGPHRRRSAPDGQRPDAGRALALHLRDQKLDWVFTSTRMRSHEPRRPCCADGTRPA